MANRIQLAKTFNEWKAGGATPDFIRAMVDAYCTVPGLRRDGANTPEVPDRENTNFKFVGWDDLADELGLAVDTDGWDPRD